jgi:hypothetical protein
MLPGRFNVHKHIVLLAVIEVTAGNADDAREGVSHGRKVGDILHRSAGPIMKQRIKLKGEKGELISYFSDCSSILSLCCLTSVVIVSILMKREKDASREVGGGT